MKKARPQATVVDMRQNEAEPAEDLLAVSRDLMEGIQSGDVKRISEAIRAAFELLDSEPHVEGPHLEETK